MNSYLKRNVNAYSTKSSIAIITAKPNYMQCSNFLLDEDFKL